jgi:hypothetical protein
MTNITLLMRKSSAIVAQIQGLNQWYFVPPFFVGDGAPVT